MYILTLGELTFPVAPKTINIKTDGQNQTINLINGGDVSIVKLPKLSNISFEVELPYNNRDYAVYENGFTNPYYYIKQIESYMQNRQSVEFTVLRKLPNNKVLYQSSFLVTIEDFEVKDSFEYGFDTYVNINLKEYKKFESKSIKSNINGNNLEIFSENNRDTESSPNPKTPITYIIKTGDTLWDIAKKYYGDGSKYTIIANENDISNPNMLTIGDSITIPVL